MFEASLRVIFGDTDQMGVVYYANYFRYFEFARSELLRAKGVSYRQVEALGFALPVVDAHARYLAPARYEDLLTIAIAVEEVRRVSVGFRYEIRRESDVLCTGETKHACVGRDGKVVSFPDILLKAFEPAVPAA